jgi:membrane protein YdbS with pleckstrin-like domain
MLRVALLLVIALLFVSNVVVGLGTSNVGPVEKAVLVAFGALLVLAAVRVQKIGRGQATG